MKLRSITVRRHQGDAERSANDFVVHGASLKQLDRQLADFLRTAQAERGQGVWSESDPEVWIGSTFVGHLERDGDTAQLVDRAMRGVSAL